MEEKPLSIPALRSSVEEILNDNNLIASQKLFTEIFGSVAGISAIINNNRQIVYTNNAFLEFLEVKSPENAFEATGYGGIVQTRQGRFYQ